MQFRIACLESVYRAEGILLTSSRSDFSEVSYSGSDRFRGLLIRCK